MRIARFRAILRRMRPDAARREARAHRLAAAHARIIGRDRVPARRRRSASASVIAVRVGRGQTATERPDSIVFEKWRAASLRFIERVHSTVIRPDEATQNPQPVKVQSPTAFGSALARSRPRTRNALITVRKQIGYIRRANRPQPLRFEFSSLSVILGALNTLPPCSVKSLAAEMPGEVRRARAPRS